MLQRKRKFLIFMIISKAANNKKHYLRHPMTNKLFFRKLFLLTPCISCAIGLFQNTQSKVFLANFIWIVLAYFIALTVIVYFISLSGLKKENKTFLTRTYGAMGLRFVFSFFPLLIYIIFTPKMQLAFVLAYMLIYLFFSVFEVLILTVNLRPDSEKKNPANAS